MVLAEEDGEAARRETDDSGWRRVPGAARVRGAARGPRRGPRHPCRAARPGRPAALRGRPGARRAGRRGARRPRGDAPPPTSTRRCAAPTSSSPRSASAAWRAGRTTSGSPSPRASSARRRSARAASPTACAPSRSPSTSPGGWPGSPPTPGSSTSPTRPAWSPRPCPATSATASSASATRRSASAAVSPASWAPTPREAWIDYVGLNHLGWVRGLRVDGRDELPRLLADPDAARLLRGGQALRRRLARSPSARSRTSTCTTTTSTGRPSAPTSGPRRPAAPSCADQQARFYARDEAPRRRGPDRPGTAPAPSARPPTWPRTARRPAPASATPTISSGGYEKVALALMRAIARDERTTLILNVRNRGALLGARRGRRHRGALPGRRQRRPPGRRRRRCPTTPPAWSARSRPSSARCSPRPSRGSRATAVKAFALHPLVDSVDVARRLVDGYTDVHPGLAYLV